MGSNSSKSSLAQAIGNVNLPRVINPTIRGSVRRSDPDGGHASPFFAGLTSKTLVLAVTPVVGNITITFVSDLMADAITSINAASPSNLKATDDDGYIRVTNLNAGNKNSITIKDGTSTTLLGFIVDPEPGSVSYSGELSTSSSGRGQTSNQNNSQGTRLVAQEEDLSSSVINRSIIGASEHVERFVRELDREIPIVRKVSITTITLPTTGEIAFVITDPTIRFPIDGFGISGTNPSVFVIDQLVRLKSSPNDLDVYDIAQSDPIPHISKVIYNTGLIGVSDVTQTFTTWGTPDGKSVFGSQLKNKQPPVTITKIRGNVIEASTALFVTNVAQRGDTVVIESANNNSPFNHNGEYVITEIIDETRISVRSKGPGEKTFVSTDKPTELNINLPGGTTYGTVRVIVGSYIPATALCFVLPSWITTATNFFAHVYCGVRLRDLQPGDIGVPFSANDEGVLSILRTHITTALAFRHHSIDVDAALISSSPHSLSAGTVASQLTALLGLINTAIAAEVAYAGGGNWADGSTNPATTVEGEFDKIITDLGGTGGTAKVGAAAISIGGGTPNTISSGSVLSQLTSLLTSLRDHVNQSSGAHAASAISYAGGAAWADGIPNPATTVEGELDKIINDLAPSTGSSKIGGAASGTDISANTLAIQIADLAVNWLKMSRANTIGGAQTFSQIITANGGLTTSSGITFTGIAEEHFPDREFSIDCSGFQNGINNDRTQGFLQDFALDGSNGILIQSFFVGAGNASGFTSLVAPLDRIRVGDKISTISVCVGASGVPNAGYQLILEESNTTTSENVVFTSAVTGFPGSGTLAEAGFLINFTHTGNTALRIRIKTASSGGGTPWLRYVRVRFQRP